MCVTVALHRDRTSLCPLCHGVWMWNSTQVATSLVEHGRMEVTEVIPPMDRMVGRKYPSNPE